MHRNSVLLFEKHAKAHFRPGMRVLEIGPDGFPSSYQTLIGDASIVWHSLDIRPDTSLTYTAVSEYIFPISDNTYDIVLSGQVIEHVRKIWIWIKEVARVCRVGGTVITINPVSWPYHEAPIDCWRVFPDGMRALYEEASLKVSLSVCESLEATNYPARLPGRSFEWQPAWLREAYIQLGKHGFPVECAFDTITVGKKV